VPGYFGALDLPRLILQRGFAAVYLIAFIGTLRQFPALLGERGLLPVPDFLRGRSFKTSPGLFAFGYTDRRLRAVAWAGIAISILALAGVVAALPWWLGVLAWLVLWFLYLSIDNVGQTFYAFGWESMLLEAGFFTAFLGPARLAAPLIPILILRWMLFRTELGAGLIKLRHDPCWRDLTCLHYHYETQPLPNPLSWYFHRIPKPLQRASVLFSHIVQVGLPFLLLLPQPFAAIAGGFAILQQALLIVSGNYAWLNWLTLVLGFSAFSDAALGLHASVLAPLPLAYAVLLYGLAALTAVLSVEPARNLFSRRQAMNRSYNPWHIVNAYGAFGSVTRVRYEIVIEGASDPVLTPQTQWREYEFKAKPGDPRRRPPQVAPYHLRLDWLMWFLPFSVHVYPDGGLRVPGYELWFLRLAAKLLQNDAPTVKLLRHNPFPEAPPRFLRARYYRYRFTTRAERGASGDWWRRDLMGEYLPTMALRAAEAASRDI
jgi:hypothetical protein